jgi:hypothetical protein
MLNDIAMEVLSRQPTEISEELTVLVSTADEDMYYIETFDEMKQLYESSTLQMFIFECRQLMLGSPFLKLVYSTIMGPYFAQVSVSHDSINVRNGVIARVGQLFSLARPAVRAGGYEGISPTRIVDAVLCERVGDLLNAPGHFDRVISQAGVVLEDRVRSRIGAAPETLGLNLMTEAFRTQTGRLVVSSVEAEQEGVHQLFRGIIGFLKNPPSHRIITTYTREQAVAVVEFVDFLLGILGTAQDRP